MKRSCGVASLSALVLVSAAIAQTPQLPIGLNLMWINYYDPELMFTDLATTLGGGTGADAQGNYGEPGMEWMTRTEGDYEWNTERQGELEYDTNGYPLELPVNGAYVHAIFSNVYPAGNYVVLYDGEGDVNVRDPRSGGIHEISNEPGRILFYLSGTGRADIVNGEGEVDFADLEISRSVRGNHVRNIHIVPESLEHTYQDSLFFGLYLDGLKPFHCLRFMQTQHTNGQHWVNPDNSWDVSATPDATHTKFRGQRSWSKRRTPTYFTQASSAAYGGPAVELLCALSNAAEADGWFCMPHVADDEYIRRYAETVKANLHPGLKAYVEYSNEVWNWGGAYPQSHWTDANAPGMPDSITSALAALPGYPEKIAWMHKRVFDIWRDVFSGPDRDRLVCVVGVQHGYYATGERTLNWLMDHGGCDMVSPGGYFSLGEGYDISASMNPADVTADWLLSFVDSVYDDNSGAWTRDYGALAASSGVQLGIYEGGSHLNNQRDIDADDAFWQARYEQQMYDTYMKAFANHAATGVACSVFVAFNYCTGIFGHLDSPLELADWEQARQDNPKWRALLDANTPKVPLATSEPGAVTQSAFREGLRLSARGTSQGIELRASSEGVRVSVFDLRGTRIDQKQLDRRTTARCAEDAASAVYLLRARGADGDIQRMVSPLVR